MKHFIISHYDLDGIGCVINIYNTIKNPEDNFEYRLVGYTSLDAVFGKMKRNTADCLWITDLNIKQESIKYIYELSVALNLKKIILVDHHVYEYDLRDEIEKYGHKFSSIFTTIIDSTMSATLKLNILLFNTDNHLSKLSNIINVYDNWMKRDPLWKTAYEMNDLFWEYKYEKMFSKFKHGFIYDDEDIFTVKMIKDDREWYVKYTLENFFIGSEETKTIFIINPECKYTNHFTLVFRDVNNYVILKQVSDKFFSYSIRLYNDELDLTIQTLFGKIKQLGIDVITSGGHDKVGAITIGYDDNEKFLDAIADIFIKD